MNCCGGENSGHGWHGEQKAGMQHENQSSGNSWIAIASAILIILIAVGLLLR